MDARRRRNVANDRRRRSHLPRLATRAAAARGAGRATTARADSRRGGEPLLCIGFDLIDFARVFAPRGAERRPGLRRMSVRITLREGDIAREQVDAIVNAANSALVLGGGVAGAIRSQGGPSIQAECDRLAPIRVGEAVATGAGDLPAKLVIHAATMPPGGGATEDTVRHAMRSALACAHERGVKTLAVPALCAGVAGLSLRRSAEILLEEARAWAERPSSLEEIRFVLFGEPAYRMFEMVDDAARVAAQMASLRQRQRPAKH
jgi:O-acetyl-ADP-ribose deacetylase (regulator of RNase III)